MSVFMTEPAYLIALPPATRYIAQLSKLGGQVGHSSKNLLCYLGCFMEIYFPSLQGTIRRRKNTSISAVLTASAWSSHQPVLSECPAHLFFNQPGHRWNCFASKPLDLKSSFVDITSYLSTFFTRHREQKAWAWERLLHFPEAVYRRPDMRRSLEGS